MRGKWKNMRGKFQKHERTAYMVSMNCTYDMRGKGIYMRGK
jgi:hypothetical protein